MHIHTFLRLTSLLLFSLSTLFAETTLPKQSIKSNGTLLYKTQKRVSSLAAMLREGDIFGRIRSNNFYYNYDHESRTKRTTLIGSLGANFLYRSANYKGFDFRLGLYGSQIFFDKSDIDGNVKYIKSAKDTFCRYNYVHTGSRHLYTFAQANLSYSYNKSKITIGRQLVETFYAKSNDSKMIPNSFDGVVVQNHTFYKTNITVAYLAKQKLKDHENAHSVFMYDDSNIADYSMWRGNDDSAMHKGISYRRLNAAGKSTKAPLILFDLSHNTQAYKLHLSSYLVPSLLSEVMGEINYKISFKDFTLTPALRYIRQFDNGAGAVGGASLLGDVNSLNPGGYKNPNSLNATMIAARLVAKVADYKINLAYTNILNEADLVTPWRAFPTAGYTRSMGIYNWRANTKSYRIELQKGASAKGIYTKPLFQASILYVNTDKNKDILEDSVLYYLGIIQNITSMPEVQYRIRLGYRDYIGDASALSNYADIRLEFNYLF
jgi:hypothetical protein